MNTLKESISGVLLLLLPHVSVVQGFCNRLNFVTYFICFGILILLCSFAFEKIDFNRNFTV